MNKAQSTVIIVLLFFILCISSVDAYFHLQDEVQTWEYHLESFSDEGFLSSVNALGAMGWELASARRAITGEGPDTKGIYECIFKRKKRDEQAK